MAVRGIYSDKTEAELIALRATRLAQREQVFAGRQTGGGARGTSFSRDLPSIEEIDRDMDAIRAALQALNPELYGAPRSRLLRATFN